MSQGERADSPFPLCHCAPGRQGPGVPDWSRHVAFPEGRDFLLLTSATTWVENEAELTKLIPVKEEKARKMGRRIGKVLQDLGRRGEAIVARLVGNLLKEHMTSAFQTSAARKRLAGTTRESK